MLYAVRVEKTAGDDPTDTTSWKYLGSDRNRILGSLDGRTVRVVFDAQHGTQPGGGFFESPYETNRLLTIARGTVDNAYVKGEALQLSTSSKTGGCETFQGVGTICSDRSESSDHREYWRAGVGPLAYYSFGSTSSSSGGARSTLNIGLVRVDFIGPPPLVVLPTPSPVPGFTRSIDATGTFSLDLPQEFVARRLTPTGSPAIPTIAASTDLSAFARQAAPGIEVRIHPRAADLTALARNLTAPYVRCTTIKPPDAFASSTVISFLGCAGQVDGRGIAGALNDDRDLLEKRTDVTVSVVFYVTAATASRYSEVLGQVLRSIRYVR